MIRTLTGVRHLATAAMKQTVSELRVPVPWGEIRGQIWGPEHGRPVLCLHGWADNCGTFNTLIPLLPHDWKFVAVDFPGHGLSSHRPAGVFYTIPAYVADVRRVVEALQWKHFSIIGHSMGGNVGGMFSAVFPEMVEGLVLVDAYGFLPKHVDGIIGLMRRGIEEMIEYEKKMSDRTERVYTYEAAKERLMVANPYLAERAVQALLERGVQKVEGGVVFTRDIKINLTNIIRNPLEVSLHMQAQIKADVLVLQATQGLEKTFPQPQDLAVPLRKGWTDHGKTIVSVEGDHHVHLNNPEVVSPIITDFLKSQKSKHTPGAPKL